MTTDNFVEYNGKWEKKTKIEDQIHDFSATKKRVQGWLEKYYYVFYYFYFWVLIRHQTFIKNLYFV